LIYYLITSQWSRLAEYRFDRISAVIGDREIVITPELVQAYRLAVRSRHHNQSSLYQQLNLWLATHDISDLPDQGTLLERAGIELGTGPSALRRALGDLQEEETGPAAELRSIKEYVNAVLPGQVLYLPTYRRIEQDLKSIFRGIDLEAQLKKLRDRLGTGREKGSYVELVEFGMQDVESTVAAKLESVKESMRAGLNSLTGTYLRDVIRGVHTKADAEAILAIDPATLDSILARLDENTLPHADQQRLRHRVLDIRTRGKVKKDDSVVVHFLSKLIELDQTQEQAERVLRDFIGTCNQY
jgi:hypothetical protein